MNEQNFRDKFPILTTKVNQQSLVYFDNAATTQKPSCVINSLQQYYQSSNANVHRSSHALSSIATSKFEQARENVKNFINAAHSNEIIWTKGTTESINVVAQSWGRHFLKAGDEIVLTYSEHHANIVPWQVIAEQTGAIIKVLPLNEEGIVDECLLNGIISENTRIVCCAHISNVIGKINPIEKVISAAKKVGALTIIDGAQSIAHIPVDVQKLSCDFYVFSAHKMYGPTGVGVLYGRQNLLNKMPVYQMGGEMIKKVSFKGSTFNDLPFKFEAGTPNIAGVIAFSSAIDFIKKHQEFLQTQENRLLNYCYSKLAEHPKIKLLHLSKPDIPIFSFIIEGHHNQDIAATLDTHGIAVRNGHHCAMPLMELLDIDGCLRVSLTAYNTTDEIDFFIKQLKLILATDEKVNNTAKLSNENGLSSDDVIRLFRETKGWDGRHRQIMLLGKEFSRMDKSYRNESNIIEGCESLVWLESEYLENKLILSADSDAKLIRGLLFIVFAALNNKSADEILTFNISDYFTELGLMQHLSPSRGNGLQAIVNKIIQLAKKN